MAQFKQGPALGPKFPTDETFTFQTPNGSAQHQGQRHNGPSGEKSRHAPNVKSTSGDEWDGNRTGE